MKPFGENRVPSLRNVNHKAQGENNNYIVEIDHLNINDRFQLSYYLKTINKDTEFLSCGFKYRFNNTTLPMLVNRGEILGTLVCGEKMSSKKELPILSYCYGQVQLAYPFLPLPIILLKEEDMFLVQLCAKKFPDYKGVPYKFPVIPQDQRISFNNTLFETNYLNLENKNSKIIYKVNEKQFNIIECLINRLFDGKSFQVLEYSIIGIISCKLKMQDQKIQIERKVIRAFCTGSSSFQSGNNTDFMYGTFKVNKRSPFNWIECISNPKDFLEKKLMNPDQAIKDVLYEMDKEGL
ncbi:hypothetical protein CmeUKMEL1_08025 [Cryptosporidium meleagridis]|uniref:Uncharacterized protein n=1 Tax=Cryptosporidium meleagridis TaxID=93969 RepID=A0A2P4Z0F0_9CRYT|nr:hypothetical protein CmeUKMEL1_08025 [Cryptosporidium meleagridis]